MPLPGGRDGDSGSRNALGVSPPKPERLNAYGNRWRESGGKWVDQKAGGMEPRSIEQMLGALEEVVTLFRFVSPSLPVSDLLSGRSYDFVSGSSGLGARGLRARGSGEHAELAVTKPAAAASRPAAGVWTRCWAACPFRDMRALAPGRHYCLRGMDYSVSGPPCTERRLRPLCTELPTVRLRRAAPSPGPAPNKAPPPEPQPYPAPASPAGLGIPRHF